MITPQTNSVDLVVTRNIPATSAEVFDLWIDPKSPGSPWLESRAQLFSRPSTDFSIIRFDPRVAIGHTTGRCDPRGVPRP
jgi:hypothetical protein